MFLALKGAGTSFGIVTEFLYKVYDVPETKPALIPVIIKDIKDLREEFWKDVKVVGKGEELNQTLERAGRVADFLDRSP